MYLVSRAHTATDTRMRGTESHSRLPSPNRRSAAGTTARAPWSPATKLVPGSPEAIKMVWSCHREVIHDELVDDGWTTPPPS